MNKIRVAINGFGRIGRLVFRIMEEDDSFEVVAVNDLTDAKELAHLLKYDSTFGRYKKDEISYDDNILEVGFHRINVYSESDPVNLPWKDLGIDVVLECSGRFTKKEDAYKHIIAGSKKVVVSAPCKGDVKTIVYGVNQDILTGDEEVISAASCTTNCLAPVLKVLNNKFGVLSGYMTTIHAYTNDQATLDIAHKKGIKARRGRACAQNIVPASTGAAKAIGLVIPELLNKVKLRIWLEKGGDRTEIYDGNLAATALQKGISLGNYNSGEEGELKFQIEIPKELGNVYASSNTEVIWVFSVRTDDVSNTTVSKTSEEFIERSLEPSKNSATPISDEKRESSLPVILGVMDYSKLAGILFLVSGSLIGIWFRIRKKK